MKVKKTNVQNRDVNRARTCKKNWIQRATNPKTKGAFTRQAKQHGKSVQAYATEVIRKYKGKPDLTPTQLRDLRRAVFAKNVAKK